MFMWLLRLRRNNGLPTTDDIVRKAKLPGEECRLEQHRWPVSIKFGPCRGTTLTPGVTYDWRPAAYMSTGTFVGRRSDGTLAFNYPDGLNGHVLVHETRLTSIVPQEPSGD